MVLTLTAIVELFGAFTLGILAYRFWQTFNERGSLISRLLFYFVAIFALYFFFDGLGILFFAKNPLALKLSVMSAILLQSLACATIAYLVLYILLPKINPWFGFLPIFILGMGLTIFVLKIPFFPSLELVGKIRTIDWNTPPIIDFFQSAIFFITFIPLSLIFLFYSQISKIRFIQIRSLGMALVVLLGLNAASINFSLKDLLKLNPLSGDISLGAFSLFLFLLLLYFSLQSKDIEEKV